MVVNRGAAFFFFVPKKVFLVEAHRKGGARQEVFSRWSLSLAILARRLTGMAWLQQHTYAGMAPLSTAGLPFGMGPRTVAAVAQVFVGYARTRPACAHDKAPLDAQQGSAVPAPAPAAVTQAEVFYCDPCEKDFKIESQYKAHLAVSAQPRCCPRRANLCSRQLRVCDLSLSLEGGDSIAKPDACSARQKHARA